MKEDMDAGFNVLNDDILKNIEELTPSEDIPDWLARIREREAAERAQQSSDEELVRTQKKSKGGVPDWLSSISEGIELSTPLEKSQPDYAGKEASAQVLPTPENGINPPPEGESEWMESLKSWQPVNVQENLIESEGGIVTEDNEGSETLLDDETRDIDLGGLIKPALDVDLPVVGKFEEISMGEDDSSNDVASFFKTIDEIDHPVLEGGSDETPKGKNAEINDSIFLITPDLEQKDQIAKVFEELQSQAEPENILGSNLIEAVIVSQEIEPAPPTGVFKGEDSTNAVLSNEPMVDSGAEESVIDSLVPPQAIVLGNAIEETPSSKPFIPDELSNWLNETQPVGEPELGSEPEQKPANVRLVLDGNLPKAERANLPVWLEAVRPVEAVELPTIPSEPTIPGKANEILEASEQFVGGGKMPQVAGKPSNLGSGLKVSERQKANASLLSIMAAYVEGTPEEESKTVQVKRYVLWRASLALVFLVIAILGGTALIDYGLQPALFPEEVVHTFDQVNSLPVDKPVLIAGDFEAGLAGEMRWSSQPLIEHLMRRNLAIALISTNPLDTALLSAQITKGLVAVPNYPVIEKVVDLGYLPGGAIAVQSLNGEFSKSVPLTAELTSTSTHPLLSSVKGLKDFGAVIVITDDSENARIWIEQIQPQIASTPLLMITSAQAAPLIQPYYQSGQLAGLVSGMPGSLVYERILQTPGDSTGNLSSLQMLSVIMAGLILLGGFISMVKPVEFGDKV